ncbi:MAG: GNAT family N-acetyltransferase [Marmoricola sp.]
MQLDWVPEPNAVWDAYKQRVIGGAPEGALDIGYAVGASLPGDWWATTDDAGTVLGYGWLDATWGGDAEILLAVDPERQRSGVGAFILQCLEQEAAKRGLNYVYNTVRETHPDRDAVHDWLAVKGYQGGSNDSALRKRVEVTDRTTPAVPAPGRRTASPTARPPGHEESGGYVDIDDHQY